MKKSTLKFLAIAMFVLMGTFVMAQTQYTINFTVDMTLADPFDPATDEVYMSGNFAGWAQPGSDVTYKMAPLDVGSMFYTLTVTIDSGEVQYKYFRVIDGAASWDNGEWTGDPNRKVYLTGDFTFENVWANKPHDITFNVDMTDADPFDPATDAIYIAGSLANGWAQPGTMTSYMMTTTDDINYTITLLLYPGDYMYKYFRVIDGVASWDNGEWNGDPNREVTVDTMAAVINNVWGDINPPVMIADFEDDTWGILTPHVMGCGDYDNDALHAVDETFMVVDNPDPSGINTSSKVLKFIRRGTDNGGLPWGGFWATCDPNIDATVNKYVHFMVWKTMISPLKFKMEGDPTLETESMYPQTETGMWQDIVFDFTTLTGNYGVVALMPDFTDPFETAEDIDMYIDNIQINSDPNPISGIWNNKVENIISMYPNPFTTSVNIDLTKDMSSVVISNLMGQRILIIENVSKGIVNIDASFLNKGLYIITLTDSNNNSTSAKLLKN
ncbi:MAG: T9SS type A sorting domain-containing protein [Bacteroidetes bacterium]|nr:T9SS type A sorting domain-containing protein [Bacteroidota bacterium]MBL6943463.1 T9SS type A sorting domain-containing protein [Bacteroidales bacterium]